MPKMSHTATTAALDALLALVNVGGAGTITVHTGMQPAETSDGNSGTLLATLSLTNPAFGASNVTGAAARALANTITGPSGGAAAAGTPNYYRVRNYSGEVIFQGSAGGPTSGAELSFSVTPFTVGGDVEASSFTLYLPE